MANLSFELQPETASKVNRILNQYSDKEEFFHEIIRYQTDELKSALYSIEIDLKTFERRFHLSSDEFYKRFSNGDMDDSEDSILWSGIYEMYRENQKKLSELI